MRQFVTSPSVVGSLPMSFVPGFDCTKTSGENMGELWQLHALTICPRRMSQASAISASGSQGVARSLGDHHEVRLTDSMRSMVK